MITQNIVKIKIEQIDCQQGRDSPKIYKINTPLRTGIKQAIEFKLRNSSLNKTSIFKKKRNQEWETDSQSTEAYSWCASPSAFKLPNRQRKCDFGKKTLVLDLDETLIHSEFTEMSLKGTANMILWMHGTEIGYCWFRPYLKEFLEHVTRLYEVVIFTASQPIYANQIIDKLE